MNLRADLPPLPDRMRSLPVDRRGYPVPFFVAWVGGEPDFRVSDGQKLQDCVRFHLCWLCGQKLGRHVAFVIGPMCAINRISSEPPSHRDCAMFAAKACPFLTRPKALRRDASLPAAAEDPAGVMLTRNPGVALVWVSRGYQLLSTGDGKSLFEVGDPVETHWFAEGRPATREEVQESIRSGLPGLLSAAGGEPKELRALELARAAVVPLLPPEEVLHG